MSFVLRGTWHSDSPWLLLSVVSWYSLGEQSTVTMELFGAGLTHVAVVLALGSPGSKLVLPLLSTKLVMLSVPTPPWLVSEQL
jgi:hypothetical protein